MSFSRTEFLSGIRDELPILAGVFPFGLIYGVSATGAHIPANIVQAMSSIIFAGSSQFVVAQLLGSGTTVIVIVLTAFIINLRHALYSASVAPYVRHLPAPWRWLLAYLLTDEAYAVAITHYQRPTPIDRKEWYFLGAGLALWSSWQLSTFVGVFLGAQIPSAWSLDFTLALTFIALVVPTLKDRAIIMAALSGGLCAVLANNLPYKLGLILAAIVGVAVGVTIETVQRKPLTTTLAVEEDFV